MKIYKLILFCSIFFSCSILFAQNSDSALFRLKNSNAITITGGFKANSKTVVTTNHNDVNLETGFVGTISYNRWFKEDWCIEFTAGIFGSKTNVESYETSTEAIVPLLFGIGYYPDIMAAEMRPYCKLDGGVFIGSAVKTKANNTETTVETVLGGRVSFGLDIFLAECFKLGPSFSYYFMADFEEVVEDKENFSGAAFELNFGFVF